MADAVVIYICEICSGSRATGILRFDTGARLHVCKKCLYEVETATE